MAMICRSARVLAQGLREARPRLSAVRWYSGETSDKTAPPASLVSVKVDNGGIATMTMQRPPVNSLNLDLLLEIGKTIKKLEKDNARGLILTSDSPSTFSAGLDILEMYKPEKERLTAFWSTLQSTWLSLYRTPIPTVAAINGHSPAGGCLFALSCEYRVMVGPKFSIGLNETQLGIVAPPWFVICMRDVIGARQTELALTSGKMFSAPEALKIGLIDVMVSNKDEAIQEARSFIARFERIPPLARKMTKELVRAEGIKYMEENMIEDLKTFTDLTQQPNIQKGLEKYLAMLKSK